MMNETMTQANEAAETRTANDHNLQHANEVAVGAVLDCLMELTPTQQWLLSPAVEKQLAKWRRSRARRKGNKR